MFFIYFLFALIAAIFVYIDSEKQQMPKWWAAVIFFAPVTMIYYIIKTRQKRSLIPLTVFILVLILVGIGESFLYTRIKDKLIYASYSTTSRNILRFTEELQYSVKHLNDLTLQLEDMTSVDSSPEKINEAYVFVTDMKSILEEHGRAVKKFVLLVNDYRDLLIEEKLSWLMKVEEYYKQPVVIKYLTHLATYLDAFSALLKYTGENLQEINARSPVYLKNYDGYYISYIRALEKQGRIDVGRMQFQYNLLVHNPELEPYMPTIIKTRFLNVWRKHK